MSMDLVHRLRQETSPLAGGCVVMESAESDRWRMERRAALFIGIGLGSAAALRLTPIHLFGVRADAPAAVWKPVNRATSRSKPLRLTDQQWRERLGTSAYDVLRAGKDEYPFSSPLNMETRPGTYGCAGCDLPLFESVAKFDSGTGWPSFFDHLPYALDQVPDMSLGFPRTALHCSKCDGYLGHIFRDGPEPTGMRYTVSGDALDFHSA